MNKFLKLATWKQIIQSRWLYYKNRNKEWYKERKKICDNCPFNSKYHKKTLFERFLGEYCTACKCTLRFKQSLKEAVCGKEEIGLKPEWESVYEVDIKDVFSFILDNSKGITFPDLTSTTNYNINEVLSEVEDIIKEYRLMTGVERDKEYKKPGLEYMSQNPIAVMLIKRLEKYVGSVTYNNDSFLERYKNRFL